MSYATRLQTAVSQKKTPALVGLDPRWDQLPVSIQQSASKLGGDQWQTAAMAFEQFCCEIIDVVAPLVPAVKPQSAFFEQCGPPGVAALQRVIAAARKAGLIVICDAKRGDIGSTAQAYAAAYLAGDDPEAAPFSADALTINPYMGTDTLQPFIDRANEVGGGLYVLVRTSNPGAGDFQDRKTKEQKLFENVADHMERLTNINRGEEAYGNVGAVIGATYPEELTALRERMPHVPLLVPGYGSQGGTSADTAGAFDQEGQGALVNSSRGIIFAYQKAPYAEEFGEHHWQDAVKAATESMIADLREHTSAKALA